MKVPFDIMKGKKYENRKMICDALRDLVPFLQFNKRQKHPWMSVT